MFNLYSKLTTIHSTTHKCTTNKKAKTTVKVAIHKNAFFGSKLCWYQNSCGTNISLVPPFFQHQNLPGWAMVSLQSAGCTHLNIWFYKLIKHTPHIKQKWVERPSKAPWLHLWWKLLFLMASVIVYGTVVMHK